MQTHLVGGSAYAKQSQRTVAPEGLTLSLWIVRIMTMCHARWTLLPRSSWRAKA